MARKPGSNSQAIRNRAARTAAAMTPATATAGATPAAPKKPFNPGQFAKEVRSEARKITWTTRKETWITSVMVAIMVVMASLFFFVVDIILSQGVTQILKLATVG